ncbi:MAG: hypothetical protein CL681_01970 [Blastopirellula sp.]|nr:hypothetical protein [Blastopirellula sp.]|tara:strand:+ start:327 stop:719 length:393 start_codon:yes stop_codon:yes gene_type:complete
MRDQQLAQKENDQTIYFHSCCLAFDSRIKKKRLCMDPQLAAFVKKVSADDALKEKVKSITSIDGLITLMKDNGFTIEAEIFEDEELHANDLKQIVGGIKAWAKNGADMLKPFAIELGVAGGEPWQTRHHH